MLESILSPYIFPSIFVTHIYKTYVFFKHIYELLFNPNCDRPDSFRKLADSGFKNNRKKDGPFSCLNILHNE